MYYKQTGQYNTTANGSRRGDVETGAEKKENVLMYLFSHGPQQQRRQSFTPDDFFFFFSLSLFERVALPLFIFPSLPSFLRGASLLLFFIIISANERTLSRAAKDF